MLLLYVAIEKGQCGTEKSVFRRRVDEAIKSSYRSIRAIASGCGHITNVLSIKIKKS